MAQQLQAARQTAQPPAAAGRTLQRVCACGQHAEGGECAECKQKHQGLLQRTAVSADPGGTEAPPIVHDVLRSPGQPLDAATRAHMEPRFGHDFGSVRIHTDSRAAASARAVNALAYTVGNHVAFGQGQFQPSSSYGERLLAHELAHTIQQRGRERSTTPVRIASTTDPDEHQARLLTTRLSEHGASSPMSASPSPLKLARSNGKQKSFEASADDLAHIQRSLVQILDSVDDRTRRTIVRNKTIVVGLAVDDDGNRLVVYTVNGNWTNKQLKAAADNAGVMRWDTRPRAEGRGKVGAPADAEQIMIEFGENYNFRVAAMAVSREVCADCQEAIKSYDKNGIKVVVVDVSMPSTARQRRRSKRKKTETPSEPAQKSKATAGAPTKKKLQVKKGGALKGIKGGRPGRVPSSRGRGGGEIGGAAVTAVASAALAIVASQYLQGEMDKKNEEAFQSKLEAQQPEIEKMIESQEAIVQELEAQGKPIFVNVTLWVRYQTDVTGDFGGITVLMDLKVHDVKVVTTKLEHVKEDRVDEGFVEYAAKDMLGRSESLLSFSLSYPDLEVVSQPDPDALPPPNCSCFIATACYGSPVAPEVQLLRQFRDEWLQRYRFGRAFIRAYYAMSPPIAAYISRHQRIRILVRETVIAPIVALVRTLRRHWRPAVSRSSYPRLPGTGMDS